jgi:hypothetical protein
MNTKRMIELRDFITKLPPEALNMNEWLVVCRNPRTVGQAREHTCGTIACLAGWAAIALSPAETPIQQTDKRFRPKIGDKRPSHVAQDLLELTGEEAHNLFHGLWQDWPLEQVTKEQVVRKLTKIIKTGKV